MDLTQTFLVITLGATTLILLLVGYQVFLVLKEIKLTLEKVNNVVGGLERMSGSVESGFNEITGFVGGMRSVFSIMDIIKRRKNDTKQSAE